MRIMKIKPYNFVLAHLEEAIKQHIDSKNYVVAITLAGAAEEVLGKGIKGSDIAINNLLNKIKELFANFESVDGTIKDCTDKNINAHLLNRVKNHLKHKYESLDALLEEESISMLARALYNFKILSEKDPSFKETDVIKRGYNFIIDYSKKP